MSDPVEVVNRVYDRIEAEGLAPVWISLVPRALSLKRAEALRGSSLPLAGQTFAVKDNIDVADVPTTAGCPAYAYTPFASAPVVERLVAAGAIPVGKTNMDQFATGLVGTRSPYGIPSSVFHKDYVSGGSSSGSAIAVAKGLVDFSLGTDTAGSGRVPAAFNNLIGVKPTRGVLSNAGVVPACRTLDCVSIFARTTDEAQAVWSAASEKRAPAAAPWLASKVRIGVPRPDQLEFFGDTEAQELFTHSVHRLEQSGAAIVEMDYDPFRDVAQMLYSGPWVAERFAAIRSFMRDHASDMDPTVRTIIGSAERITAADAFDGMYRLDELRGKCEAEWEKFDVLLLPTTGTIYRIDAVRADPIRLNSNLGYYTNFVNLLDLAAVAVPAGFRSNGLPFGVSFIGRAGTDQALLTLSGRFLGSEASASSLPPGCVELAVVGAHLTGQPLNRQLTERGARLMRTCRTASDYRLYALPNTTPPKPGLVRETGFSGRGIELEVWAMPESRFGSFVAEIPPPLGIGSVTLEDGATVKCFICEPYALHGARDITSFGGWRAFLASA